MEGRVDDANRLVASEATVSSSQQRMFILGSVNRLDSYWSSWTDLRSLKLLSFHKRDEREDCSVGGRCFDAMAASSDRMNAFLDGKC